MILKLAYLAVLTVTILITLTQPAHAYIDPGTGSLVIQAAGALILATLVTMRVWMVTLKRVFRRLTGKSADAAPSNRP